MDTHTRPAQDQLSSDGQSFDTDELERETATERSAHPPSPPSGNAHDPAHGSGQVEKDVETASLPSGNGLEPEHAPLSMPGEHETEAGDPLEPAAPAPAAQPSTSTRNMLLGTALALALMVGGGSAYVLFHRGHGVQMATLPPPVWHPEQATRNAADPAAVLATNPFPTAGHPAQQAADGTDDILAMRQKKTARPPAVTMSAPKVSPPAAVAAAAAPVILAPPPTTAAAASTPPDPVATALAIRPAPMATQQLVDVMGLLTELGALVRDMRTENAQLRDKVASLDDALKAETSDVSQRLSLMEARKAIASAQEAGRSAPALSGSGAATPGRFVQSVAVVPVPTRSVRDYRVQAASPGLAILADADAAPGQSAGLQVAVGDQVPGVGRITSIAQRGTAWVVQTNHGAIQ